MRRDHLALMAALLLAVPAVATAQTRTVRGTVRSEGGQPLAAQVVVRGTNLGTLASADGTFTLGVPRGDVTLQATFIGYRREEVAVGEAQTSVEIVLRQDVLNLEEIVVTGQATGVSRRNLANAVATVSADEVNQVPSATVEQALQGKVAGAQISINSGAPGGGGLVRMRGLTSIIGNFTPLYVVDGVIVNDVAIPGGTNALKEAFTAEGIAGPQDNPVNRIADLNPHDIESIEVLKGASAAAIYGSRASNGVIIITTKRGQAGKPQFNVSQKFGTAQVSNLIGTRRFATVEEARAAYGDVGAQLFQAAGGQVYDNEKNLFDRNPLNYETSASVNGGNETTRYYASGLVRHDGGIVPSTFFDKHSLRLNLDQLIGRRVSVGLGSEIIHTESDRGLTNNENNGSSLYSALKATPSFLDLRRRADGTYPVHPFETSNPFHTADVFQNRERVWRFIGSLRADVEAIASDRHSLRFNGRGGGDIFTQKNSVLSPPELQFEPLDGQPGTSVLSYSQSMNFTVDAAAVYRYTTSGGTSLTTQAGVQYIFEDLDIDRTMTRNLLGGLPNVDLGTAFTIEQDRQRTKEIGYFGQAELLTLEEKLLLTLGLRMDRTSNNADPDELFYYPKAAASYRWPLALAFLDEVKFRAAWGQSGNQPRFGQKFTNLEGANILGLPVFRIGQITGAPDLRPERQREIEGGIDLTLFDGRGTVGLTGYEKRITDLLLTRTLPPTTGFRTEFFNGGTMRTRGFEAEATFLPVQGERFDWSASGTFSLNRCTILDLPVPSFTPTSFLNVPVFGATFIEEGASCTQLIGNRPAAGGGSEVGKVADGNTDYRFAIANTFGYGPVSLYALVDRQKGGVLLNATQLLFDLFGNSADQIVDEDGDMTGDERVAAWGTNTATYLQDISYWKLREATISIDLPSALTSRISGELRYARLMLSGRNLVTLTPYEGHDPEFSEMNRSLAEGVPWEIWSYPPSRTFWLGIDIGF